MALLSYLDRNTIDQMAREQKKIVKELKANDFIEPSDFVEQGINYCYAGETFEGQVKDHKAGLLRDRNRTFLRLVSPDEMG